jgi:hypothetical protein
MKVAISISGETRNHNDPGVYEQFWDHMDEFTTGHECDFYGHTWTRCDSPKSEYKLKRFIKTDQNEIWETFARRNIFNAIPFNRTDDPRFIEIVEDTETGAFAKWCRDRIDVSYGQFWSFYNSFKDVDVSNYDICIRWRWDHTVMPKNIDRFWEHIDYLLTVKTGMQQHVGVYVASPGNSLAMHDCAFALKPVALQKIYSAPIAKSMERTIIKNHPGRWDAHRLWNTWLQELGIEIGHGHPLISSSLYKAERPYKYWQN